MNRDESGPEWSLVTVTYNSSQALIEHFAGPPPADVEWIVVDNASSDDSASVASDTGRRVIRLDANVGFASANNIGLAHSSGRYVAFVNPDVTVCYDDLPVLARKIEHSGTARLVAPQLLNPDGEMQPNGRGVPSLPRKVLHRFAAPVQGYDILAGPREDKYVAWAMGAAIAGRTDVFRGLGGWSEAYFVYYEDHELGLRAWETGTEVVLTGAVRWVHAWARETTGVRLRPWLLELRGAGRFFRQYPELLFSAKLLGRKGAPLLGRVGTSVSCTQPPRK